MLVSRRALFGKLNLTLFRALESATAFAKLRGNPYVELLHWLQQLWGAPDGDLQRICRHFRLEPARLEADFTAAIGALPAGASAISDFSHHIELAIERAWVLGSVAHGAPSVRGAWLVSALMGTPELRRVLLDISFEFQKLPSEGLGDAVSMLLTESPESKEGAHDGSGMAPVVPGVASGALAPEGDGKSALTKYCADLTERARAGQIDPVIGREHEIRTMVDILLRRRQNNPLLTGEAGVGKTAVVEGLALAIVQGEVPPPLREVRLLSLDVGSLLAGASMRGEFEARLKGVLEEAGRSTSPIILFVDEVHTLVGAGGQAGTGDAANLLKPALARGTLRTVGATTWSEYKRHIEKDPALTRRFQVLQVMEPQEAAAVDMVRGLVSTFTQHHGVAVLDSAVIAAVTLSHRYIPSRQLPDKAISLLDTACARVAMSLHAPPASVARLRERIRALEVELQLLGSEQRMGKDRQARIDGVQAQREQVKGELVQQEAQWHSELALVQCIQRQRTEQGAGPGAAAQETDTAPPVVDVSGAPTMPSSDDAPPRTLAEMEAELVRTQGETPRVFVDVDEAVVAAIVSDWTGIPVGRMVRDEVSAVLGLQAQLARRVIGQPHALAALAERVQTARARLTDPGKPVGTFLLVGPSGVGKTETALALAEALYGGEQNLITINMSEYQEAHTVSSLKGAPPGYVGYGEGGVLTEAVRRRPYSVILLDEVEKAHPDVHEVFYQVFDKGWMEDGEGRVIDFKNTLILLTSNTGSDLVTQLCDDIDLLPPPEALHTALLPELRRVFPAAFLGRLSIVPYLPLGSSVLGDIVRLQLNRVVGRMQAQHGIALTHDETVIQHIVARCGSTETGARLLAGFIEQHVLPPLAGIWLNAMQQEEAVQAVVIEVVQADDHSHAGSTLGDSAHAPSSGGLRFRVQRDVKTHPHLSPSSTTTH